MLLFRSIQRLPVRSRMLSHRDQHLLPLLPPRYQEYRETSPAWNLSSSPDGFSSRAGSRQPRGHEEALRPPVALDVAPVQALAVQAHHSYGCESLALFVLTSFSSSFPLVFEILNDH